MIPPELIPHIIITYYEYPTYPPPYFEYVTLFHAAEGDKGIIALLAWQDILDWLHPEMPVREEERTRGLLRAISFIKES